MTEASTSSMPGNRPRPIRPGKQKNGGAFAQRRQRKPSFQCPECTTPVGVAKEADGYVLIQMGRQALWSNLGLLMGSVVASAAVCNG